MSVAEVAVVTWSGVSAVWWLIAIILVHATRRIQLSVELPLGMSSPSLTIFKPLPSVPDVETRDALAACIASFLAQLDESTELVVGVPEEQAGQWAPVLREWANRYSRVQLRPVIRATPGQRANPKVAWLEVLAPEAGGELWLWSDADVVAPPGFLAQLLRVLALNPTAGAVTAPYGIRFTAHASGWLDALFVNMEFLPGALLLGRLGPVPLAFGAAVLFRAEDFRRRISWDDLGASLADDHETGRRLAPVVVSRQIAETCALESRLGPALRHVYRWQKTIRWCRPGGFAALVVILPLFGWVALCTMTPGNPVPWVGLAAQYALESGVASVLLSRVGFRGPPAGALAVLAWPALRALVWFAAWLPIPVTWGAAEAWNRPTRRPRMESHGE